MKHLTRKASTAALTLATVALPATALAHTGDHVHGGLMAGLTHPVTGLDHLVALVLFGAATGTLATGLALVRLEDPELEGPVATGAVLGAAASMPLSIPLLLLLQVRAAKTRRTKLTCWEGSPPLSARWATHLVLPAGEATRSSHFVWRLAWPMWHLSCGSGDTSWTR